MKMLMIVCTEGREADVRGLIARHGVHAYSEFRDVTGEGATGKRLGSATWPGTSVVILTVVPAAKTEELMASLRAFAAGLYEGEGLRAFVMPVESAL